MPELEAFVGAEDDPLAVDSVVHGEDPWRTAHHHADPPDAVSGSRRWHSSSKSSVNLTPQSLVIPQLCQMAPGLRACGATGPVIGPQDPGFQQSQALTISAIGSR